MFTLFVDPIMGDTGQSQTSISGLYAVGTGISAIVAIVASRMVDRFGPRMMLGLSAFAFGLACIGLGSATGAIGLLFGFAALRALGQSSMPISATLLTAQWFVRYRGRAMALLAMGYSLSNALFPPFAQLLIDSFGWRNAYRALGITIWLLVIPLAVFLVRDTPEQIGLLPDGHPPDPDQPSNVPSEPVIKRSKPVWRTLSFWLLASPLAAGPFVSTALIFHQASIFAERGLSATVAANSFVAFAITSALTTVFIGFLVERVEPRFILFASMVLLTVSTILLTLVNSPLSAIVYIMLLGCVSGCISTSSNVMWAYYYGRVGLGEVQGLSMTTIVSAAAIGPLPLAALQSAYGSYTVGLYMLAALPVLFALPLLWFRASRLQTESSSQ